MANLKDKLQVLLEKHLTNDEKRLLQLISFETSRKDKIVLRMPVGVIMLDALWKRIQEIANDEVPVAKADSFATIEELDDVLGNVEWLWKDWIPKGFITLLAGDPGIGKTMFAVDLARIVSWGVKFPMETELCPDGASRNVVWIDAEAGQQILRERCISLNVNRKHVYIPVIDGDILSSPDFLNAEHRATIDALIDAKKPELLVLDSLGGSNRRGENKVEEVRPLLEYFAGLARDRNISVIILHHLNKGSPGEATEVSIYRLRGSTAIPAYCRSILALERGTKENELKLRVIKSNLSRLPEPLAINSTVNDKNDVTALHYARYTAPAPKKTKKEFCAEWVIKLLKESDGLLHMKDAVEMGELKGYTRQMIYGTRDILGDQIIETGTGRDAIWKLTTGEIDNEAVESITSTFLYNKAGA